jgi:serine/threonine-protein kinase
MNARPTWILLVVAAIAVGAITVGWGAVIQPGLRGYGPLALGLEPTQTPHPTLSSGSTRVSESDGMTMVFVPAEDFEMGWRAGPRNERPRHTVYMDAFWIDHTEVTNGQYARCVRDGGCTAPARSGSRTRPAYFGHPAYDDYPVIYVDWQQAKAYCEWAGRRLPTEAEWEKAARGVDGQAYPWGDRAPHPDLLNYDGQVGDTTAVGSYPSGASPYGALDMLGNVTEWVSDCFDYNAYRRSARQNPAGPVTCRHGHRAIRGSCSWATPAHDRIGAADRLNDLASTGYPHRGFRCALSPRDAPIEGKEAASLTRVTAALLG